jgi:hypothetical protein
VAGSLRRGVDASAPSAEAGAVAFLTFVALAVGLRADENLFFGTSTAASTKTCLRPSAHVIDGGTVPTA